MIFSHKPEFRVFAFTEASYSFKEIKLNTVGGVKAYTVYFEFLYPVVYSVYEMIAYAGISKIELYKVIMTVPAFIPKNRLRRDFFRRNSDSGTIRSTVTKVRSGECLQTEDIFCLHG